MEVIVLSGVLLVSLLSFPLLHYYYSSARNSKSRVPPGKTGWPFIGESIEFVSCQKNVSLEKFSFRRMLKYCPDVFRTSLFGDHVAVLCGSAGNKLLFTKNDKLVKPWKIRPIQLIFRTDEKDAPSLRKNLKTEVLRFAAPDNLKKIIPLMDEMAQQHLRNHWDGQQVITVYPSVKKYALALTCRIFLSIEDQHVVDSLYSRMETFTLGLNAIPINLPGTRLNRALKAVATLRSELQQIVRQQVSSMQSSSAQSTSCQANNFIAHIQHSFKDDKVVANVILAMLLAGTDTVGSVMCMCLKVMADEPEIYRRVYEENMAIGTQGELLSVDYTCKMKYTWNVAREVMRLYPPTGFLTREASVDFTFAGFDILKGTKLITNIHATHKDPKYFPDPQKFDPSRFDGDGPLPYTFIPFGGGSHLCPGMNYAHQLILVFIHNVVKKFKWEAKIVGEKVSGIPFPKPSEGLPIILHPHAH